METAYKLTSLSKARYKYFKWNGDIDAAREIIKDDPRIAFFPNKKEYIKGRIGWDKETAMRLTERIPHGKPFVITYAYHTSCDELKEDSHFIYGLHPRFDGMTEEKWEVFDQYQMAHFVTAQEAAKFITT